MSTVASSRPPTRSRTVPLLAVASNLSPYRQLHPSKFLTLYPSPFPTTRSTLWRRSRWCRRTNLCPRKSAPSTSSPSPRRVNLPVTYKTESPSLSRQSLYLGLVSIETRRPSSSPLWFSECSRRISCVVARFARRRDERLPGARCCCLNKSR